MKTNYTIFLIALLVSCSSTKQIPEKYAEINNNSVDVKFSPRLIEKEIGSNFFIEIEPIDARDIDSLSYEKALFGGDYHKNKSVLTLIEEKYSKPDLSQNEKSDLGTLKQRIDFISEEVNSGQVPADVGEALKYKLWYLDDGIDIIESKRFVIYPSTYNPYKIGANYLSVIKMRFHNASTEVKVFKRKSLLINSGEEQLEPYGLDYFEEIYGNNQKVLRIAHRLSLPDELTVPPGQSITKYVSIPSLNVNVSSIIASVIEDKSHVDFKYDLTIESNNDLVRLRQIHFKAEKEFKTGVRKYYFVIQTEDSRIITLKENTIYLPDELMNQKLDIYSLASIDGGFAFDKILGLRISDSTSNVFWLKFEEEVKNNWDGW